MRRPTKQDQGPLAPTPLQYAVVGRLPGQDADTCLIVNASDATQARVAFVDWMWRIGTKHYDTREECLAAKGVDVYITGIVAGHNLHMIEWEN